MSAADDGDQDHAEHGRDPGLGVARLVQAAGTPSDHGGHARPAR